MHRKIKRIIIIFIALCLLAAGMCPEKKTADSGFLCTQTQAEGTDIVIPRLGSREAGLCTPEMLGVRADTYVRQNVRRAGEGEEKEVSVFFVLSGSMTALTAGVILIVCNSLFPKRDVHIILLNYIHKKDGKK